ncbi:MAG: hypothetical protein OXE93_03055 [bacterium]|nr:hypothetical protein [bacterium]
MLTKLTVRNFKGRAEAEIELGNPVVFVGPNDSGRCVISADACIAITYS